MVCRVQRVEKGGLKLKDHSLITGTKKIAGAVYHFVFSAFINTFLHIFELLYNKNNFMH